MISLIIPTLNESTGIRKCLDNLQTAKNTELEIIISDGKSTDDTLAICREYTDKIVVYNKPERQTIANGRNLGAQIATGDYLVFIDADVIIPNPNEFFKKAQQIFADNPQLLALTTRIKVYPETETLADKFFTPLVNFTHYLNNNIFKKGSASGEFQMIKHGAYKTVKGYNDELVTYEDNDMFERLAKIGQTRFIKELTIYHSGRRAHKIGWPKLLTIWIYNAIHFYLFKKAAAKEWKVIR